MEKRSAKTFMTNEREDGEVEEGEDVLERLRISLAFRIFNNSNEILRYFVSMLIDTNEFFKKIVLFRGDILLLRA